jgi:hypothetical protein
MTAITLRNLPPELAALLERKAAESGLSLNRTVVRLLEESLGLRPKASHRRAYHDLDFLLGVWTAEEASQFDQALAEQRKIDPEMWS